MARSRKRITHKDLSRPDQFITLTSKAFRYFERNRSRILFSLALVIVVFLILWGWGLYKHNQDRLAAQVYSRALMAYRSSKYQDALDGFLRLSAYRWSSYRRFALLYRAQSHIALKQPSEAIPVLKEFLKMQREDSYLRQLGFVTLGYAHEEAGQCSKAVAAFEEAQKLTGPLQEDALLALARCSTQTGNLKEALSAYQDYLSKYPGSPRSVEISLRIQEIESKMKGLGESKQGGSK